MTGFLGDKSKKPELTPMPEGVDIKSFDSMVLPGNVQGMAVLVIIGLGTDNKIYRWYDDKREWFEQ